MTLMIISENRRLLMEISHYFLGTTAYHIEIVHTSPMALESFTDTKPEFVIIDENTAIPYRSMLRAFLEYAPQSKFLVISEQAEDAPEDLTNVILLPVCRLSRSSVLDALEQFRRLSSETTAILAENTAIAFGHHIPFRLYHDSYYILLGRYIERGRPNREQLAFNIRRVGEALRQSESLDAVIYDDLDVLVIFRKSTHTRVNSILGCVQRLCDIKYLDSPCYTVFALEHVRWNEFEERIHALQAATPFCYFFPGQIVSTEYIEQHQHRLDFAAVDLYAENILCEMLQMHESQALQLTNELLFYHLKSNLDIVAVRYFRERLLSACLTIMATSRAEATFFSSNIATIYDEYEQYQKYIAIFIVLLKKQKISELTIRALQYAIKNLGTDVSLSAAADELHISKEYLSHVFKKDTEQTFLDFLQSLKFDQARLLLEVTDLKIYEIAATVGYRDAQYFSRIMKKHLGVSPEQYRQGIKQKEMSHEGILQS